MKPKIYLLILMACAQFAVYAQSGKISQQQYIEQQQRAFRKFAQSTDEKFKKYKDSLNAVYANYLTQEWKRFELFKPDPLIKNPIKKPPVYDPNTPKPEPEKVPVIGQPEPVKPQPKPQPAPEPQPQPQPDVPPATIQAELFGTPVTFPRYTKSIPPLHGVGEKEVAAFWNTLSALPYYDWTNDLQRIAADLNLNDWGMYMLANKMFETYFPHGTANEKTVFAVFMLNQLGYRAKIGRAQNELLPLVAFQNDVYNTTYFIYGDDNTEYSVVNFQHKDLPSIQTCRMEYPNATRNVDLRIAAAPRWAVSQRTKTLSDKKNNYEIGYNKNMVDFYATYPCVTFSVYAEAAMDNLVTKSIEAQLKPKIQGKSQEDAINILLHFVQYAFEYKTDNDQFGYERWFFAEETVASSYSDCEDRSILFAQLVRRLLGMKVVLIHYPGVHLATAVKFDNPNITGDYLTVDGQRYLICDPTYIGANLGMSMPDLRAKAVEVIKLK
ncbi:hypothetical protein FACS1894201_06620 [Bacteroidia bacterium]|nr:hypothetical protein FACS1894201_06620 [Bacteroidia bacterium]